MCNLDVGLHDFVIIPKTPIPSVHIRKGTVPQLYCDTGFSSVQAAPTTKTLILRMGENEETVGSVGVQLRSYQLEMLEENMRRNIIVAVREREAPLISSRDPDDPQDGHRFGQNHDSRGAD